MKKKTNTGKRRAPRAYTEAQLTGLRASTLARKQATVERLQTAINALRARKQNITVQTIYEECGLRYAAIHRNPEALELFRLNSTHLSKGKKRTRRTPNIGDEAAPSLRDPLLNYKKPQLVARVRATQQQQVSLVEASLKREARIAELEARLAVLEPYRIFVEQMRLQMQREEQGRFGDLPPSSQMD